MVLFLWLWAANLLRIFRTSAATVELGGMLCRLPKVAGFECGFTEPHPAFYYDSDINECLAFMFKGCGGNQNRFATKEECVQGCGALKRCGKGLPLMDFAGNFKRCDPFAAPCPFGYECTGEGGRSLCCQTSGRVCRQSVDSGSPCGIPAIVRYYYDPDSSICRSFSFTGCGGNENNFQTKGHCMQFCSDTVACLKGDPMTDRFSVSRIAKCAQDSHCPKNYTCEERSGRKACCPSKASICGQQFNPNAACHGRRAKELWTFDLNRGLCEKIEHPGCMDELNSFASAEQCIDFCIGRCPGGQKAHMNLLAGFPQLCNPKSDGGCPMGFECTKTSEHAALCCKTDPVCPKPESLILTNPNTGDSKRCAPENATSCPEGYICQQAKNLEHICCTVPLECPYGMKTLRESYNEPRICSVGVVGTCPSEYDCIKSGLSNRHICCQPTKTCIVPYVDPTNNYPLKCLPGNSQCPVTTHCLPATDKEMPSISHNLTYYCCHNADIFICPDGSLPQMDKDNRPAACNPSDPAACPSQYICQRLVDGSNTCCKNSVIVKLCVSAVLDLKSQKPIKCAGWDDNTCQIGKCRRATDDSYYCCNE